MRTASELNQNELEELRDRFFYCTLEEGGADILGDYEYPDELPMSNVIEHYTGVYFVEDDFFCNLENDAKSISNFTRIRRTIGTLKACYPCQSVDKATVLECLNDKDFQHKYVEY